MAINVNTVYRTVLLILNKEQRGYMTPDEFNAVANQVQRQIFDNYCEELNIQTRLNKVYDTLANKTEDVYTKLEPFYAYVRIFKNSVDPTNDSVFLLSNTDGNDNSILENFYKEESLAAVNRQQENINKDRVDLAAAFGAPLIQKVTRREIYATLQSPLAQPTKDFPIYCFLSEDTIKVLPESVDTIDMEYLTYPSAPIWAYNQNPTTGVFEYSANSSNNFELSDSEFSDVVLKILAYSGIIIKDPLVIQAAANEINKQEQTEKI